MWRPRSEYHVTSTCGQWGDVCVTCTCVQATHSAGEDWDWPPVRWPKAGTGTEVPADRLGLAWTENYKTDVLYSLETETVQGARDWRALRSWQSAGNPASGPDWPRDWHLDGRAFAVLIKQYQAKEHRRSYTGPRHASGQSVPKCSRASHPASHEQSTRRRRTHAV